MADGIIRRGTTPPVSVEIVGEDWTGRNLHLTFQAGGIVTKSGSDLTVSYADGVTTVQTVLTQADTLSFKEGAECDVQVRAFNSDGSLADATEIGTLTIGRIIEEGALRGE